MGCPQGSVNLGLAASYGYMDGLGLLVDMHHALGRQRDLATDFVTDPKRFKVDTRSGGS